MRSFTCILRRRSIERLRVISDSQFETDEASGAGKTLDLSMLPFDEGAARELQGVSPSEVDEQQSRTRVEHQISERVEVIVSGVVGEEECIRTHDADEAGFAASVRSVHAEGRALAVTSVASGDKERVGALDRLTERRREFSVQMRG